MMTASVRGWSGVLLLLTLVTLTACGIEIPPDRQSYVGEWQSQDIQLRIGGDGRVEYARQKGSARTTVSGPIQAFEGDDFVVGFLFIKTRFVVSRPPYQDGNAWKMVVDGVELVRPD